MDEYSGSDECQGLNAQLCNYTVNMIFFLSFSFLQIPSQKEELKYMLEWSEQYSYAFPRWFGNFFSSVIVTHPEYAKTLFARGGKCMPVRTMTISHAVMHIERFTLENSTQALLDAKGHISIRTSQ